MHLNDGQRRFSGIDTVRLNGYGLLANDARHRANLRSRSRAYGDFGLDIPCPKGFLVPQAITDACNAAKKEITGAVNTVENAIAPATQFFAPSKPQQQVAAPQQGPDAASQQPDTSQEVPVGTPGAVHVQQPDGSVRAYAPMSWLQANWKYILGGAAILGVGVAVVTRKKR